MDRETSNMLSFAIAMYNDGPCEFRLIAFNIMNSILSKYKPKETNPFIEGV